MKKIILFFVFFINIYTISAQEWQTDFGKTKEIATKDGKTIILVFQGSDWCAPCIKLDREIWSTTKFKELAKKHFVMLLADFPRRKQNALPKEQQEHNNSLAEKYNTKGYFPYVVILNTKGKVLGNLGYEKTTPELYFKKLKNFEK
jgi:thioredoxin-related protein